MKEYKFKHNKQEMSGVILSVDWNENTATMLADDGEKYNVQVYRLAMESSKAKSFTFFDAVEYIRKEHPKK